MEQEQPRTSKPIFIQEVDNLEKIVWTLQSLVKMMPFYPPPHYKSLQKYREQNKQY